MAIGISENILRALFSNAYFITGTAYAGKSTMVRLLSERHGGIMLGENYFDKLTCYTDAAHQPSLNYFNTMASWQEFISRPPEVYDAWIQNTSREASELEIIELIRRSEEGRKIFVDTNIHLDMLRKISDKSHVAVMLCEKSMSVERFFERPDPEKQFLLSKINESPDPEATMANFKRCLALINGREHYREYAESGFEVFIREDDTTIEDMLSRLERHFGLVSAS